jgi:hypothetical protein
MRSLGETPSEPRAQLHQILPAFEVLTITGSEIGTYLTF